MEKDCVGLIRDFCMAVKKKKSNNENPWNYVCSMRDLAEKSPHWIVFFFFFFFFWQHALVFVSTLCTRCCVSSCEWNFGIKRFGDSSRSVGIDQIIIWEWTLFHRGKEGWRRETRHFRGQREEVIVLSIFVIIGSTHLSTMITWNLKRCRFFVMKWTTFSKIIIIDRVALTRIHI